jgi:subtilisin family serine protease
LIFTLVIGEDAATIPARSLVISLGYTPARETGHGAVDRVLRSYGGNVALSRLHDPADSDQGFDLLEHARGVSRTYVATFTDTHRIDQTVDALRQLAVVTEATPDYFVLEQRTPLPSSLTAEPNWAWHQVGAEAAHALEEGDPAITTAVLDTGAATHHAELTGRLSAGFDAVNFAHAELPSGLSLLGDFGIRDVDPTEGHNPHGTACLAIIGGQGHAMPAGLSRQTTLMPVRVLASARKPAGSDGALVMGLGALSDIDYAIKRSVDLGAKVLNCSFGTSEDVLSPVDPRPHAATTAYALARGTIMVAASGNSGRHERYYPAAVDGVVAVGSVGPSRAVSDFTTRGDHVALCAPGERILTPAINGYDTATGTSFAAPFAAGAAALLVAKARRLAQPLNSHQVRDILITSARPWEGSAPQGAGAGTLDIPAALAQLDNRTDATDVRATA